MLDFRILGPLEVDRDGVPVEISGPRQQTLLVLLLLRANRVVSRDRLIDALWGERPPPNAAVSLRNAIVQLRKLLGEEAIRRQPPGYALLVESGALDLERFERGVDSAREAPTPERARRLREALGQWRGTVLPELAYEACLEGEIRRLDDRRIAVYEDVIDAELTLERHVELLPEIESLCAEHPDRERLCGQHMLALYRSGRVQDALQAYHDARRRLDELGLEPPPELREMHGRILRREAGLEHPRENGASTPTRHLMDVAEAMLAGRVVPVLATSVDLAPQLARRFRYPQGAVVETARVSQYAAALSGYGPLYDELRTIVDADVEPGAVHRFFASLPPLLRERGVSQQLLVTTDYDGALERAFAEAGEEVDVVVYLAAGRDRGRFCHVGPDRSVSVITDPSDYVELSLEQRPVVLRIRGRMDSSPARDWESFVVTEDDHIDFGRANVEGTVPVALSAALRQNHFLFLGYSMSDWCLRLVLGRIWTERPIFRSWAIAPEPGPVEEELWRGFGVHFFEDSVDPYVAALSETIGASLGVTR